MSNPVGRPLKFQTAEELEAKIEAYFNECNPHMVETTEWVEARDSKGQLKKDENGMNYLVEVTYKKLTPQIPYTITGLANYLDTSRETLLDYEDREEFSDTIKKAKDRVHAYVEARLFENNPTGPIFNLKNNFGWKDKTETEISGGDDPVRLLLEKYGLKEANDDGQTNDSIQGSPESSSQP